MKELRLSIYLLLAIIVLSCKGNSIKTAEIKGQRIAIDEKIEANAEIEEFIQPFKQHLNKTLALMPFENEIVVAELSGEKIKEMLTYLERAKTAHPVSGIQIEMDQDYKVTSAKIKGEEIDEDKTYFVATSDYLQKGGDNMSFFKNPIELYKVDYKLRNAIIDYFKKVDTLKVDKDNRFIRK